MNEATRTAAFATLRQSLETMRRSAFWRDIVEPRDQVYARFRPIFAPDHLQSLTAEEFKPFLYFENNHHWTGLHRQVNRLCDDMPKLRSTLATLLDEARPVEDRLNEVNGSI